MIWLPMESTSLPESRDSFWGLLLRKFVPVVELLCNCCFLSFRGDFRENTEFSFPL